MQNWLRTKFDHITAEFLAGGGTGAVFEATYLAYLECLVAHWGGTDQAARVWIEWGEVCTKATPSGEPVRCMSNRVTDREELVKSLHQFRRRFEGPTHRAIRLPAPKVQPSPELTLDSLFGD